MDIDAVVSMYNLIEYSDNYSKASGSWWQYYKNKPAVNNNGDIVKFNGANATDSFSFKVKMTGQTGDDGAKEVEVMVSLNSLSNFWKTLKMSLINCEVNLVLTLSENCVVVYAICRIWSNWNKTLCSSSYFISSIRF